jgi:zinc protease
LVVLAREMRHAPVAAFSVWYRVGSRNEVPGITGISHWVEHMMYKGSARFGKGAHDRLVSERGGQHNGFTTEDFTAYYEVLPAEHLELAVELEADRMGHATFEPREVDSERTVIISEREGSENRPTFWLNEATDAACWTVHPYRQGVIGAKCDLREITRDELWHHYRAYYSPDNAVVVATGDFSTDRLFSLVETHFGPLARGPARRALRAVEPPQTGQRRVEVCRPGPASYLMWVFHIPAAAHPDMPALMCLSAIMGGGQSPLPWRSLPMGRSSRLSRELVRGGLATRVGSHAHLRADPSVLEIHATARQGVTTHQIESVVAASLDRLRREAVSEAELASGISQVQAQIAYTRAGVLGQAEWYGAFSMLDSLEAGEALQARLGQVTAADVQRVASTYLQADRSTLGWFLPKEAGNDA